MPSIRHHHLFQLVSSLSIAKAKVTLDLCSLPLYDTSRYTARPYAVWSLNICFLSPNIFFEDLFNKAESILAEEFIPLLEMRFLLLPSPSSLPLTPFIF